MNKTSLYSPATIYPLHIAFYVALCEVETKLVSVNIIPFPSEHPKHNHYVACKGNFKVTRSAEDTPAMSHDDPVTAQHFSCRCLGQ